MKRAIVHMDMDTFFVSCERLRHSELVGKPIIIGGGERGVVASCSYETRYYGVRSAMPMKMALRLCPEAKVIRGDMEFYTQKSLEVTEIIKENVPTFEKASVDEFYLDLSGMDRFFGCYKWSQQLAQSVVKNTGLPLSFALSSSKTVSKIGTGEAKPLGKLEILPEETQPFLNPLSIRKIPMVGPSTYQLLSRIGIRRIHTLSQMPLDVLERLLGKNAQDLWRKANGIDLSPVVPYSERKSISSEHTFSEDTMDTFQMQSLLNHMVEQLCFQLRKEQWLTSVVSVKIRYSNFDTESRQMKIPYSAVDHTLSRIVKELFKKVYTRRMRLRLVGVRFSGLVHGSHQMNLFEDTEEMIHLYQAMDRMKLRYGKNAVGRASGFHFN